MKKSLDDSVIVVGLILLSGIYIYCHNTLTAFDWPVLDMGPFWERQNNSNFLINDFFTNASSDLNPRHFYGYFVLWLSHLLNLSWYEVIYFLKLLLIVLFPSLIYASLSNCVLFLTGKNNFNVVAKLVLAIGSGALLYHEKYLSIIAVAWWGMIDFQMIPSSAAFFLSLIILCTVRKENLFWARGLLWFLATMFHPAVTLFVFLFYSTVLFLSQYCSKRNLANCISRLGKEGAFIILGMVLIVGIYGNGSFSIPTKDFINIYVHLAHPLHYDIQRFSNHIIDHFWWESMCIIGICFLVLALILKKMKKGNLFCLPIIFLSMLCMAIFCQWFFIYIVPLKAIAVLGVSRYSFLSYYQMLLCLALVVAGMDLPNLPKEIRASFCNTILVALVFIILGMGMKRIDDPKKEAWDSNTPFWTWVQSTSSDVVFAVPPMDSLPFYMGMVGSRAVFVGNGFPFSEKYFLEYGERHSALYGTYEEIGAHSYRSIGGLKENAIYHSRSVEHFLCLSQKFRLDYIIRQRGKPFGENSQQYSFMEVFRGARYIVYNLNKYQGKYSCG